MTKKRINYQLTLFKYIQHILGCIKQIFELPSPVYTYTFNPPIKPTIRTAEVEELESEDMGMLNRV